MNVEGSDGCYGFELVARFRHDRWSGRDWNFMTPDSPRNATHGTGGFERYDFPGGYPDDATGTWLSEVRAQEMVHDQIVLSARSNSMRLVPGRTFDITDGSWDAVVGSYLVVRARHVYERLTERT